MTKFLLLLLLLLLLVITLAGCAGAPKNKSVFIGQHVAAWKDVDGKIHLRGTEQVGSKYNSITIRSPDYRNVNSAFYNNED